MQDKINRITDEELKEIDIWLWCFVPRLIDKLDKLGLSVVRTEDIIRTNNALINMEDDLR